MRIGLVGYGTGGKNFHSPYIEAAVDCELAGIVARAPATVARAQADWPRTPIFSSLAELIDSGVDAVTISTPPATRQELVLEAVGRKIHVIADKPFAPSAAAALELVRAADAAGVLLSVFHNRRWDADIRTLRKVLTEQQLGDIWRFESRMDQDDPGTLERGPEGGLLRDLGSHLVDQALWLFGPAGTVYANLDWIDEDGVRTDAGFMIAITHRSGVRSYLSSSKLNGLVSRELRLLGSRGSYVSDQTDVQAQAIFAGRKPIDDREGWGREIESRWGTLTSAGETSTKVPSEQGAYQDFYSQFAAAALGNAAQPVPAAEAIGTLEVLDGGSRQRSGPASGAGRNHYRPGKRCRMMTRQRGSAVRFFEQLRDATKNGQRKNSASGEDKEDRRGNSVDQFGWVRIARVPEQEGEEDSCTSANHGSPNQR